MNVSTRARVAAGVPAGGQFATEAHSEAQVSLNGRPGFDRNARRALLEGAGFAPAVASSAFLAPETTAQRRQWWDEQFARAEYGNAHGDYPQMPDDNTPGRHGGRALSGNRRTHRMAYRGNGMTLRMPSATAIKRFADEGQRTFDVPVVARYPHGDVAGWVRVTRGQNNTWSAKGLGFSGVEDAYVGEAVRAVMEARRPTRALAEAGDLLERRRAHQAATGVAMTQVDSSWIRGAGYDDSTHTMIMTTGNRSYGYNLDRSAFTDLVTSPSPGRTFTRDTKNRAQRVSVDNCPRCGRFFAAANAHACPVNDGPRSPEPIAHNAAARARFAPHPAPPPLPEPPAQAAQAAPESAVGPVVLDAAPVAPLGLLDDQATPDANPGTGPDGHRGQNDDSAGNQAERVLAQSRNSARHWGSRYLGSRHHDVDDLTQDAVLAVLTRARNAAAADGQAPTNGETWDAALAAVNDGYIHTVARREAVRALVPSGRSEDVAAMGRWTSTCTERSTSLGRPLTSDEEDALAEQIRQQAPPNRRPHIGFHRTVRIATLDDPEVTMPEPRADFPSARRDDFSRGSAGDAAERYVEQGGKAGMAAARRVAWNAVAEGLGAPPVASDSMSERHAASARQRIESAGGVAAALDKWSDGTLSDDDEQALFAPFGGRQLPTATKSDIAHVLGQHPAYAPDLWNSAIGAATSVSKRAPRAAAVA